MGWLRPYGRNALIYGETERHRIALWASSSEIEAYRRLAPQDPRTSGVRFWYHALAGDLYRIVGPQGGDGWSGSWNGAGHRPPLPSPCVVVRLLRRVTKIVYTRLILANGA